MKLQAYTVKNSFNDKTNLVMKFQKLQTKLLNSKNSNESGFFNTERKFNTVLKLS